MKRAIAVLILLPTIAMGQETTGTITRIDAETYRVQLTSYGPIEWSEDPPLPECYSAYPWTRTSRFSITGPFGMPENPFPGGWGESNVVEWYDPWGPQPPVGFDFMVVEGVTAIALTWSYFFWEDSRVYQSGGPPCPPCSGGGDPCYTGGVWSIHASGGDQVYAVLPQTIGDSAPLRETPVAIAAKSWGQVKALFR